MITDEPTYQKVKNPRAPGGKFYIPFLGSRPLRGAYRTATEAKARAVSVFNRYARLLKVVPNA